MPSHSQRIIGVILVSVGLIILLARVFDIYVWLICWPVSLILVGVWLLFRPQLVLYGKPVTLHFLGDIKRIGNWKVKDEEIWLFVGDVEIDLSQADIPPGLTTIRIYGFVGEVELLAPQDVGVLVSSTAFLTDGKLWGMKQERFFSRLDKSNTIYKTAERKVLLDTYFFVTDLDVSQVNDFSSDQPMESSIG